MREKGYSLSAYITVMSLSYLALGVTLPAISLIVVSKGYQLQLLALAMFCMSFSVIAFEVPSGILCDMKGRRISYQFGLLLNLAGTLFLFSNSFLLLCFGFSLTGIGRAFGSGSLDALMIEESRKANAKLEDSVFALEVSSSLCIALGAILGGFLLSRAPQGEHLVNYVLVARFAMLFLAFFLTWFLIPKDTPKGKTQSFGQQMKDLVGISKMNPLLVYYLATILLQGILLAAVEGYWQPYLKTLLVSSHLWVLGLVAGSVFATSIAGSYLGKFLLPRLKAGPFYASINVATFLLLASMGFVPGMVWFLICYELLYLFLGTASVVGSYLLNANLSDNVRSSFLSLSSFSLQIGGVLSSSIALSVLSILPIPKFWILVASLLCFVMVFLFGGLLQRSPRP